jgi:hypothetical protein
MWAATLPPAEEEEAVTPEVAAADMAGIGDEHDHGDQPLFRMLSVTRH